MAVKNFQRRTADRLTIGVNDVGLLEQGAEISILRRQRDGMAVGSED